MHPTIATDIPRISPFLDINKDSNLEQIVSAWQKRTEKLFSDKSYQGHLERVPPHIVENNYSFFRDQLPLRLLINTKVASAWYNNPELYNEISCFQRDGFELINPGDVVFDCGAHHGIYSMVFADAAGPNGRILAFEPVPINSEIARLNVDMNGFNTIEVLPVGLGACRDKITISMQSHSTAHNNSASDDNVQIQIETLDTFAEYKPNFVKIDIEGAEVDALSAASALLIHRPRLLISVHPPLMGPFRRNPKEIFDLVDNRVYNGYVLEGGRTRPVDDQINFADYFELLFLPR